MDIYLIRHGQTDERRAPDPYTASLSAEGQSQAQRVASQSQALGIQFVCASSMICAQQTADALVELLPDALRWDLQELEDLTMDDLLGEAETHPLVSTWSKAHLALGYERTWIRVMAAWARISIYARANHLERIAIVAHASTLNLLLLNWLGLDWRAIEKVSFGFAGGGISQVTLAQDDRAYIAWVNRI
jgi:broad specificity phosphatase PhoE